ncbi:response regulator, partial [Bacillus subtilis]|nr:response regulator [Bacillus subtilis]
VTTAGYHASLPAASPAGATAGADAQPAGPAPDADARKRREAIRERNLVIGAAVLSAPLVAPMLAAPFGLDLMLPGEYGLSICRRLRGSNDRTPIIMLTAKGEDVDRIVGLEMGADDYLPKPFNPRELVARIHAVLRRQAPAELPGAPSETTEVFEFGEFSLNLATRTLTKSGQEIPLTTGEFSVLKVFARHPRQPLSREKLMELARGREYEVFERSLDVQISRLRTLI